MIQGLMFKLNILFRKWSWSLNRDQIIVLKVYICTCLEQPLWLDFSLVSCKPSLQRNRNCYSKYNFHNSSTNMENTNKLILLYLRNWVLGKKVFDFSFPNVQKSQTLLSYMGWKLLKGERLLTLPAYNIWRLRTEALKYTPSQGEAFSAHTF